MTELAKKKKVRGGHRAHSTKLLGSARELLEDYEETWKDRLTQIKIALMEKLDTLKGLDEAILDLVSAEENGEEIIASEIEESENIKADIRGVVLTIEERLKETIPNSPSPAIQQMPSPHHKNVKAKLPKLEVKKFGGKIQEWQEFWDSFQSSINENESLSAVD